MAYVRAKPLALQIGLLLCSNSIACAQTWQPVRRDVSQNNYEVDISSIAREGNYIASWYRVTFAHDPLLQGSFHHYHYTINRVINNCSGMFSLQTIEFLNGKGEIINSINLPPDRLQFTPIVPGSMNQSLQRIACDRISSLENLAPALKIGPKDEANWKQVGLDPTGHVRWFVNPESVSKKGDIATFILKSESDINQRMPDGVAYKYYFAIEQLGCENSQYDVYANDSYDDAKKLIYTWKYPGNSFQLKTKIQMGTIAAQYRDAVCSVAPIGTESANKNTESDGYSSGTGWLSSNGYLVTANHVIAGKDSIVLAQNGNFVGAATVVVADAANDIAVLKPQFKDGRHFGIPLRVGPVRLGERAFTLGYPAPDELGLNIKMTSGEVSATSGSDGATARTDDPRFIQTSVPVQSGNSGGPLLDEAGRAIGIVVAKQLKISDTEVAQNVNYAVKIIYLQSLLADLPPMGTVVSPSKSEKLVDVVSRLKGSVFLIVAGNEKK